MKKRMWRKKTVSENSRNVMYLAFFDDKDAKLSRIDIIDKLRNLVPELVNSDGVVREGVINGVIYRRHKKPIPFVKKIGKGHKSYFIYTGKNKDKN